MKLTLRLHMRISPMLTLGVAYSMVILVAALSACSPSASVDFPTQSPVSITAPAGLPEHFSLGLANRPDQLEWMSGSEIPWDFRYQYLSGGVNTGDGWTTWDSPTGGFAERYMEESDAHGYMPVFTYYMIVHSNPNPGDENARPKLRNPSTMTAYYADWKLLMEKAGSFKKPVIVHHEPDLWAFLQQGNDDPAKSFVAVESSGFGEASGFTDDARGFARLLVSLRDRYAPNVLLAWHASTWATGPDLVLNHANPVVLGEQTGRYFNSLEADFDLVFFDPSDRDAAYYEFVKGDGGSHWWDDSDFSRFREFVRAFVATTHKPAMLWQLPIGNTLYRSSSNTRGHYQDNRVQYFMNDGNRQHIVEYIDSGVIGILFGRGTGGQSNYLDSARDGITNPPPINGNDLVAEYADDDGGFLRLSTTAYYRNGPVPLK